MLSRIRLFIMGIALVILLCFGAYWGVMTFLHSTAAAPFKPHMAEYLAPVKNAGMAGAVKGKMVVVNKATRDVDWDVFFDLPDDLRAAKPEEVGAVVWVEYGRELGDLVYGDEHLPSYVQTCKVTVLDNAGRDVIGSTALQGGPPPKSIDEHDKEGVGPKPTREVIDYLKSLPRGPTPFLGSPSPPASWREAFVPTFWRVRLMLLIAVIAALAAFGGYWGVAAAIGSSQAAPFKSHVAEYLAAPVGRRAGPVRGKMVVVDKKTQDIDWDVFFGLPDALRAGRPEDVGTVVWLEYGRAPGTGTYGKERLPSFFQTCQATVIDRAGRAVIGIALVHGGPRRTTSRTATRKASARGPRPRSSTTSRGCRGSNHGRKPPPQSPRRPRRSRRRSAAAAGRTAFSRSYRRRRPRRTGRTP